jgi:hypothetical protein
MLTWKQILLFVQNVPVLCVQPGINQCVFTGHQISAPVADLSSKRENSFISKLKSWEHKVYEQLMLGWLVSAANLRYRGIAFFEDHLNVKLAVGSKFESGLRQLVMIKVYRYCLPQWKKIFCIGIGTGIWRNLWTMGQLCTGDPDLFGQIRILEKTLAVRPIFQPRSQFGIQITANPLDLRTMILHLWFRYYLDCNFEMADFFSRDKVSQNLVFFFLALLRHFLNGHLMTLSLFRRRKRYQ